MDEEFDFTLPRGYLGPDGRVHRDGTMRLARAGDEILPLEDPRVHGNRAYLVILLLSRVVTRLGDLQGDQVTPDVIENLFTADLAYLQGLYFSANGLEPASEVTCPHCGKGFRAAPSPAAGDGPGAVG